MKKYMSGCLVFGIAVTLAYVLIYRLYSYIFGQYANLKISNEQNNTLNPGINYIFNTTGSRVKSRANYKILFWNEIPSWMGSPNDFISKCQYNGCTLISDNNQMRESDAVIFHGPSAHQPSAMRGKLGQVWVFLSMESPKHTGDFFHLNNKLNWTWTYRRDSDIADMYGQIKENMKNNETFIFPKRKALAWIVSNCHSKSNREEYVNLMRRYTQVDTYGRCGNLKCGTVCSTLLEQSYSFYLSFENSLCRDYTTEKALVKSRHNIVPVVRSGSNTAHYLPPNSYINTQRFKTVKRLVERLMYLQSNKVAYSKFHKWRKYYTIQFKNLDWCELCRRLHFQEKYKRLYADFQSWWKGNNELGPFCTTASDIR